MNIEINRQLLGLEDLAIGIGTVVQTRSGEEVDITKINADNIPYDADTSIKEKIDNFSAILQEVDALSFNETAGITAEVSEMTWNADAETLDIGLNSQVTLQVGQELLIRGTNTSGSTIADGKVLMATGVIGNSGVIAVGLHTGTKADGHRIAGIATQNFANNEVGFATIHGKVRGINCTGTPYGETWAYGDRLWVSPSGNGALTNIEPNVTQLKMLVAIVINNTNNGTLEVRVSGIDENAFVSYLGTIEDFEGALI